MAKLNPKQKNESYRVEIKRFGVTPRFFLFFPGIRFSVFSGLKAAVFSIRIFHKLLCYKVVFAVMPAILKGTCKVLFSFFKKKLEIRSCT